MKAVRASSQVEVTELARGTEYAEWVGKRGQLIQVANLSRIGEVQQYGWIWFDTRLTLIPMSLVERVNE